MPYQVVWARCNVFDDSGQPTTLTRGEYVPADTDPTQLSQLATIGATRYVDSSLPTLEEVTVATLSAPLASDSEPDDPEQPPVGFVDTSMGVASGSPLTPPGPDTEPLLDRGGEDEDSDKAPAKSASKPEWEAYAVSQGMSQEDAESTNKADLIAKFGG